jgi:sugar phosphate isomerase/epimerase
MPRASWTSSRNLSAFWTRSTRDILKICFDTGHHSYAGFDPVAFMKRHIGRISYMHFKDIDPW